MQNMIAHTVHTSSWISTDQISHRGYGADSTWQVITNYSPLIRASATLLKKQKTKKKNLWVTETRATLQNHPCYRAMKATQWWAKCWNRSPNRHPLQHSRSSLLSLDKPPRFPHYLAAAPRPREGNLWEMGADCGSVCECTSSEKWGCVSSVASSPQSWKASPRRSRPSCPAFIHAEPEPRRAKHCGK